MSQHVLIMAGGTGGHVFPALAVADELKTRGISVSWIGTERGIESTLVPKAGLPIHYIKVAGLRGNGLLGWLLAPFKLVKAVYEAIRVIKTVKPNVVLGLGGFASGPGGVAAKLLGKPLAIHEQNAIPGMTNQLLSRMANRVMEAFAGSFKVSRKAVWVGNPVRQSIETLPEPVTRLAERKGPLRILVLGGSLGARALNTVLPQAIKQLVADVEVKHQCGKRHIDDCKQAYLGAGVTAEIVSFIDDMAEVYGWADLVICRAGALTIAELSAAGVAALLVPFPYAVDDHQTKNAQVLTENGAAKLFQEQELSAELLAEQIDYLAAHRNELVGMANAAREQANINTAAQISDICMELAHA